MSEDKNIIDTGADILQEDAAEIVEEIHSIPAKTRIRMSARISAFFAIVTLVVFFAVVFPGFLSAPEQGRAIGESLGEKIGKAMGSFAAVAESKDSAEEGRKKGLSAEDTIVEINSKVSKIGILEVLKTDYKSINVLKTGEKYAELYKSEGKILFTVDLSQITAEEYNNRIIVTVPDLQSKIVSSPEDRIVVAQCKDIVFNGSTTDGRTAYFNSVKQLDKEIKESADNFIQAHPEAKETARRTIEFTLGTICNTDKVIEVRFHGEL